MLINILLQLFFVPNFPLKIGVMTMIAILLGGTLKINWKDAWKIVFVFMLYIVFQMWIHETIVATYGDLLIVKDEQLLSATQIAISIVFSLFYIGGFILGMFIVKKTNKLYEEQLEEIDMMLEEIQKRQSTIIHEVYSRDIKEETEELIK